MARNRTIYANEVLMVSPSATGLQSLNYDGGPRSLLRQIKRTQSINYSWNINRSDVNQYGNLARIDTVVLEPPTVNLDFTYLLTDGKNEHLLGFDNTEGSDFLHKDFMSDVDGRNFYIYTTEEGKDAATSTIAKIEAQTEANKHVVALGNCYVTNYSVSAAVGGIPTANVSTEAFNIQSSPGTAGGNPAIHPTGGNQMSSSYKIPSEYISTGAGVHALLPGDIDLNIGDTALLSLLADGAQSSASHIQSVSIDVPLSRTTLNRLGNPFGYSKVLDTPITANISISAILADKKSTEKSLFTELSEDSKSDVTVAFRKPNVKGSRQGDKAVAFTFNDIQLISESYGMSIGDNRSVDYNFTAVLGGSSSDKGVMKMAASGVYEQIQVFETGVATDTRNRESATNMVGYGCAAAANNEFLVIGASGFPTNGEEKGCAYIYKNNKGFYTQIMQTSGESAHRQANLTVPTDTLPAASNAYHTNFGASVAVSPENLIAIGMPNSAQDGAVAIYEPNLDKTAFSINTVVFDSTNSIKYGESIAFDKTVSGDGTQFLAIGSPNKTSAGGGTGDVGAVYVSRGNVAEGVNAFSEAVLLNKDADFLGPGPLSSPGAQAGSSVAIHEGVIVAGAPYWSGAPFNAIATDGENQTTSGAAIVWAARDGDGSAFAHWDIVSVLTGVGGHWGTTAGASHNAALGTDVDIFKNTIVVGAPSGKYDGVIQGAVLVYTGYNPNSVIDKPEHWNWATTLVATPSFATMEYGYFGTSVSMPNKNTIIASAPGLTPVREGVGSAGGGRIYVFTGDGGANWTQTQEITYTGHQTFDAAGQPQQALAATQKEIFVGNSADGNEGRTTKNRVIRYRI